MGNVDFANFFLVLKAGKVAGPYATLAEAKAATAVTMNYGLFINSIVTFLIVAFAVFLLIKQINRLKKEDSTGCADDEGVSLLPVDGPPEGHPLPPVHLGAQGLRKSSTEGC